MKVAVYGTLRKGQSNNSKLGDSRYLGTFESDPEFVMKSIQDAFPGIKLGGRTSVIFEVYDVDMKVRKDLDELEGYYGNNNPNNHYNRKIIITPWGRALTYVYNHKFSVSDKLISSGNWNEYIKKTKIKDYA